VEGAVYLLCTATALACGILLIRGYSRSHARMLLWCGLFFLTLAAENAILFIDLIIFPSIDLLVIRRTVALVGITVLLYGLIWEVR
jgi:hypothetical protein